MIMYLVYQIIYNTSIYYMRDPKNLFPKTNKIMGVEVKGAGEGVVIADRGSDYCNNQSSCGCLKRYYNANLVI